MILHTANFVDIREDLNIKSVVHKNLFDIYYKLLQDNIKSASPIHKKQTVDSIHLYEPLRSDYRTFLIVLKHTLELLKIKTYTKDITVETLVSYKTIEKIIEDINCILDKLANSLFELCDSEVTAGDADSRFPFTLLIGSICATVLGCIFLPAYVFPISWNRIGFGNNKN
jgi:hypothetical protein